MYATSSERLRSSGRRLNGFTTSTRSTVPSLGRLREPLGFVRLSNWSECNEHWKARRGGKAQAAIGCRTNGFENYGIIGNIHTAVGMDGSIDWLCFPHFVAAILDDQKGGRFKISPTGFGSSTKQFYWPNTNVLITRFFAPEGIAQVTHYMPTGL